MTAHARTSAVRGPSRKPGRGWTLSWDRRADARAGRTRVDCGPRARATDDDVLLVHTADYLKKCAPRSPRDAGCSAQATPRYRPDRSPPRSRRPERSSPPLTRSSPAGPDARSARSAHRAPRVGGRGMGFCVFNNIAIGARYARRRHGVDRILIADWDVHHGNGTQEVFWSDGSVLFFDTHQHPWYPGTGSPNETGDGQGQRSDFQSTFPGGFRAKGDPRRVSGSARPGGGAVQTAVGHDLGRLRLTRRRSAGPVHS